MAELNEAILAKIGVPNSLLGINLTDIEPFIEQFGRFKSVYKDYQVFIVTGQPSLYKDAFVILMLKWFIYNNPEQSACYGSPNSSASLIVIPSIESTFNKGFGDYIQILAQAMYEKKVIICDVNSVDTFQLLVGKELFKYMSYSMGIIDLNLKVKTTIKEI